MAASTIVTACHLTTKVAALGSILDFRVYHTEEFGLRLESLHAIAAPDGSLDQRCRRAVPLARRRVGGIDKNVGVKADHRS
jgi:hypothetical protein